MSRSTRASRPEGPALRPRSAAVRAGVECDTQHGAVIPPLHLTSTFAFESFGVPRTYDYTRSGNPTRDLLGNALAELEEGVGSVVTSSGMAAVALVLHLLEPGDVVLAPHDAYGGTARLMGALQRLARFEVVQVDQTDPDALERGFYREPRLCWVETPSNPLLRVTDLQAVAERCRGSGTILAVDNTFLSPALQRPGRLGADVVIHSTTKFINGHSDVVGGAVVAVNAELLEPLAWWANCLGIAGAPFDAHLTLRGLRTLHARMEVHERNAIEIVGRLAQSSVVSRVHHPSLSDHPGHEVAIRQQDGFGAIVSFELEGGTEAVRAFLEGLTCFSLAESLGGTESLVAHPTTMTHASLSPDALASAGIGDSLLRLSVGIEDPRDLVADLDAALGRAERAALASRCHR